MNFFTRILGIGKSKSSLGKCLEIKLNEECRKLLQFKADVNRLLAENRYIAKSDYVLLIENFSPIYEQLAVMQANDIFSEYCSKNHVDIVEASSALALYQHMERTVNQHNENYLDSEIEKEKEYLDRILYEVDPQISLDQDQRKVVLCDEDYCLVIAGAGAGKTTTVAAKVKYLTDKKQVAPKQILVISFTNKAVDELKEKINEALHIDCPITTFHAAGNSILRKQSSEQVKIVEPGKLYFVVRDFFRNKLLNNESLMNHLVLFFGSYFDSPYEGESLEAFLRKIASSNYSTLKSDMEEFKQVICDRKTKKLVTICNEKLRSYEEVEIANFLYLNQIEYEYEPLYPFHIKHSRKPYTPDFLITQGERRLYLEHFGITESGKNNRYSAEQLESYIKTIDEKIQLHRQHGTSLIYTFSKYNDGRSITKHLEDLLNKEGLKIRPRSSKEIAEKLVTTEENRYIRKLVMLICRFINNFKTNGYGIDDFQKMYHSTSNERSRLFLNICSACYLEYQKYLLENQAVDFEDMINESARILREVKEMRQLLDFKYIIVDEYQDISKQRFDLTKALAEVSNAKIIAVGDDWQSIYAFSGSDIELFTKFTERMGYGKMLKIVKTYRNAQEVIDIAGNFIQKNRAQIKKRLESPKTIENPVIIYTYDSTRKKWGESNKTGADYELARSIEIALEQIMEFNKLEGKKAEFGRILLLGRFGFDGDHLEKSGLFEYVKRGNKIKSVSYPGLNITFMTAHASKGLGYDNVIIINGKNETYGFPSKIEDDPVLSFVIKGDHAIDYAEERRLFYVAMTRTKGRVYFIAPERNPSEFLLEIKRDYKNILLKGKWNENSPQNLIIKNQCPICGYPLQFRYKNSCGLRMFICTNEPEVCGFLSNDLRGEKMSVLKCDQCIDGYLIVRANQKENGVFLGCTNYKDDGTGCNNTRTKNSYYRQFDLQEKEVPVKIKAYGLENFKIQETKTDTIEKKNTSSPAIEMAAENNVQIKLVFTVDGIDIYEMIKLVLECVESVSRVMYHGVSVTVDILRGTFSAKIEKYHLERIPQYGKLKQVEREKVIALIEWLVANHYLLKTTGQYPVLHPTYEGQHFRQHITTGQMKNLKKYLL